MKKLACAKLLRWILLPVMRWLLTKPISPVKRLELLSQIREISTGLAKEGY